MRMIRTYVLQNFEICDYKKRAGTDEDGKEREKEKNVDADKLRGRSGRKGQREEWREGGRTSERARGRYGS